MNTVVAEKAVIGIMLIEPDRQSEAFKSLTAQMFSIKDLGDIFLLCKELDRRGERADAVSIISRCKENIKAIAYECGMYREMLMQDGAINPVTGLFWQKNYDGLQDQQEIITATKDPLGENMSRKEIEDRFSADFVEIDDFKEVKEPEQLIEPVQTKPRREKKQAKETE